MKSLVAFILLAFIFSGCSKTGKNTESQATTSENSAAIAQVISVTDLLANPELYDAKEIALKGTVVHVCKHSGKRLHLLGSDESSQIRVEAGEIGQFDKALEGTDIVARGVFHLSASGQGQQTGGNAENHDGPKMQGNGSGQGAGRMMMEGEGEPGEMQGSWVEGISFETVPSE
ncbi:MAG: hypothetical protein U5K79_10530 [Cyclobacteriaceae bacterium]|nr:hypothetical protein [Cyclobacteriaceae bacterium]